MSRIRYTGASTTGTALPIEGPTPLRLRCRCGEEWKGSARTDERLLDGALMGPALPLTTTPPCPQCKDSGNLQAVSRWEEAP